MTATLLSLDWSDWVGRTHTQTQRIDLLVVEGLAASLDWAHAPQSNDALPPGWHWLFFNPVSRRADLGEDGHPRRDLADSFLPPVPLPRRMWVGSRIRYLAPLTVDARAQRQSTVLRVTPKEGRSGPMCFVTVEHTTLVEGQPCIVEEQDIVYRDHAPAAPRPSAPHSDESLLWSRRLGTTADTTLLFRYSALTFNGHRIHYDMPYARNVEGYESLVVHGPLTATWLQGFACALHPQARLASFEFRGVSPLYVDEAVELQAHEVIDDNKLALRAVGADGRVVMVATAQWTPA